MKAFWINHGEVVDVLENHIDDGWFLIKCIDIWAVRRGNEIHYREREVRSDELLLFRTELDGIAEIQ